MDADRLLSFDRSAVRWVTTPISRASSGPLRDAGIASSPRERAPRGGRPSRTSMAAEAIAAGPGRTPLRSNRIAAVSSVAARGSDRSRRCPTGRRSPSGR